MFTKQSSSFLSRSLRLSNRNLFPIYFFSNNPQINKKNKEVYDEVVRSTTALKLALKNLTEAQALSMGMQSQDALRKLKNQQVSDLQQWEDILVENRVRPSVLAPLIEFQFTALGYVSSFLGKGAASRTTLLFEKILEEYSNENLRILNENNIEEKNLRKALVEVRDNGYDIAEELKEDYQIQPTQTEEQIAQVPKYVFRVLFDITRKL